jgi:hypothetical protein
MKYKINSKIEGKIRYSKAPSAAKVHNLTQWKLTEGAAEAQGWAPYWKRRAQLVSISSNLSGQF